MPGCGRRPSIRSAVCSAVQSASLIPAAIAGVICKVLLIPTRPVEGTMLVNGPYFKLRHYPSIACR